SRSPAPAQAVACPGVAGFPRTPYSSAVFRIDFHVVEGEITSPDRGLRFAAVERRAHRELGFFHRRHPLLLAVGGIASPLMRDAHCVDVEIDLGGVRAEHPGSADGGRD